MAAPRPWRVLLAAVGWLLAAGLAGACATARPPASAAASTPSAPPPAAIASRGPATEPTALPRRQVKIAYPSASLSQMEFMYAADHALYERYGVAVEALIMGTAPAVAALVNGDLQYIYSGSTPLLSAARGLPVRAFFQGSRGPNLHLFAHPTIGGFADLRGKTVSVLTAAGLNREVTELVIQKHGVDPREVQFIASGSAPAQMEHLRQGLAVAATISPPWPLVARRDGYRLLAHIGQEIVYPFGLFVTTTQRLAEEPAEVTALIRGTLDAQRRLRDDPAAAIAWIQRRFEVDYDVAAESYELVMALQNPTGEVLREGVANYFRVQTDQPALRDVRFEDVADERLLRAVLDELAMRTEGTQRPPP
jgi:ABC-type nitrate/sulfonate/bicarbonate transport system substrate-binding protein